MGKQEKKMIHTYDILVDDKLRPVYRIKDREHMGLNDSPKNYWVWLGEEGVTPVYDSEDFVPYCRFIRRPVWELSFKEYNSVKFKWGDYIFRQGVRVEMKANGNLIYAFTTYRMDFAVAKAQYLQVALAEHPYDFFNPEKEKARKIWWKGMPAFITPKKSYTWEIIVHPDLSCFSKNQWWEELARKEAKLLTPDKTAPADDMDLLPDDPEADHNQGYINWGDAFSDQHIDWFRS